jgi:hypothetical protein
VALLRSGRFWAAFLGYLGCVAVPLFIQDNPLLVGVLLASALVGGVLVAILRRNVDRPVAAGIGCGVLVALAVGLPIGLFFALWLGGSLGPLP